MRGLKLVLPLAAVVLLSGCGGAALPYAREMGDMALLRTMGVDTGDQLGGVEVTVSTGKRVSGLQGEQQPSLVLAAEGGSLSGACLAMQGLSDSYVFYGYVDQLLLGEELAHRGIQPVLEYFSRDVQLGLGVQLWLVRDNTAHEAVLAGGEKGVDSRLATMQTDSEMGAAGMTQTAGDVYRTLLETGSAYLPALFIAGENPDGGKMLLEHGYGIFTGGSLAGYLEGEAARGLELLLGHGTSDILELVLPTVQAAARITETELRWMPIYEARELVGIQLLCQVRADLEEVSHPVEQRELRQLKETLEERERTRICGAWKELQRWGADCIGLAQKLSMADPAGWNRQTTPWEQVFSNLPIEVEVEATIERTYGD